MVVVVDNVEPIFPSEFGHFYQLALQQLDFFRHFFAAFYRRPVMEHVLSDQFDLSNYLFAGKWVNDGL